MYNILTILYCAEQSECAKNIPWPLADKVYIKNGFKKVDGIYEERIDDDLILREYGFEIEILR